MNNEQYAKKQEEILKDIPVEFHSALSYYAYEQGHSAGLDECFGVLQGLVSMLKEPIEN